PRPRGALRPPATAPPAARFPPGAHRRPRPARRPAARARLQVRPAERRCRRCPCGPARRLPAGDRTRRGGRARLPARRTGGAGSPAARCRGAGGGTGRRRRGARCGDGFGRAVGVPEATALSRLLRAPRLRVRPPLLEARGSLIQPFVVRTVAPHLDAGIDADAVVAESALQVDRDVALEASGLGLAAVGREALCVEHLARGGARAHVGLRGKAPGVEVLAGPVDILERQPELTAGHRHAGLRELAVRAVVVEESRVEVEAVGAEELRVITEKIAAEHDLVLVCPLGEALAGLLRGAGGGEV